MKPQQLPALIGEDFARGTGGAPITRTEKGWRHWARQEARRKTQRDGFTWHASVAWIEWRGCFRICFGGQPEVV